MKNLGFGPVFLLIISVPSCFKCHFRTNIRIICMPGITYNQPVHLV